MLEEEQTAVRLQNTRNLLQRRPLVGDAAQHPRDDSGVERGIGERQLLGGRVDDLRVRGECLDAAPRRTRMWRSGSVRTNLVTASG